MTTNPTVDTGQPAFMDSGLAPSARPGTTRMSNKAPRSSFATIVARLSADEATADEPPGAEPETTAGPVEDVG